jgi:sugar phosphate isomerase/epimerase
MRLGGPVFVQGIDPEQWIAAVKAAGYRAAYCPVTADAWENAAAIGDMDEIKQYTAAAAREDIVIAEVGAWSNPLSPDAETRRKAIEHCQRQLALADEIGARCCVNIAGSRGGQWDGPHADNLTRETFEQIVETVREIIDLVRPKHTYYTLEPMPWMYPDSPDSYLELIRAIDRERFAVHLDPVNMINCPQRYFNNGAFLRECFTKLGPYIQSVHAKDTLLAERLTTHLDEARPGLGTVDYRTFLSEMSKLPADTPLMLEHLPAEQDYQLAAGYVRTVAGELGVTL